MSKESKNERFVRLAEARVNKIIKMVRLLGNLCGVNYIYSGDRVNQIFETLQTELDKARKRFLSGKKDKKRFSLSEIYDPHDTLDDYPDAFLPLPDGTHLRAVAIDDPNFPAINIYWGNATSGEREHICFAEFNPERDEGHQICIGVYQSDEEDTKYYAPYVAERK